MTITIGLYLPNGWAKHVVMGWFSSHYHRSLSRNKHFEWQSDYFGWTSIFSLDLDLIPTGSDHAGFGFSITVLGFMISAKLYDSRHWDDDAQSWKSYSEETYKADYDTELEAARKLIERDAQHKAELARLFDLASPEGQAEVAAEKARIKEEKRLRGEAYRAANIASREPE